MLDSKLLTHRKGYIDGEWCDAVEGRTLSVRNPANGALLAEVPFMGDNEAIRAIGAANTALSVKTSLAKRKNWLVAIADLLEQNEEYLSEIITLENGKPLGEAGNEVLYAAGFFRYCASQINSLRPRKLKEHPRGHTWTVYARPAGVAALITPWNFPLAMLAKKLSSALSAGCPCVIKPAEQTPLTVVAFFHLLECLKLPRGFVNLVLGDPEAIGRVLCDAPAVRVISFTGSTAVGRLLLHQTAERIKRVTLELGGNAPFIVFEDADLELAVEQLIQNKFRASGQTCVCANRVYIQEHVFDAFATRLVSQVSALKVGNGMHPGTQVGPLIDRRAMEKVERHIEDATSKGARRLTDHELPADCKSGYFYAPTVLSEVTSEMLCSKEETFGPVVPLSTFRTEQEAVKLANQTEYGLAAYLFTKDKSRARRVLEQLRFGHVGLNSGTGPTPEAPFGGMKSSGLGREGGHEGILEFIELQTVPMPDPV